MKKNGNISTCFRLSGSVNVFKPIKLTVMLLMLLCLQVSARTYSQNKITLNMHSVALKKALAEIEKKSSYHFLYNKEIVSNKPRVTIEVTDADISSVLTLVFANTNIH